MAQQHALINKKGMTLVEVMIAMVLSLIIFLALMQTSLIGISYNVRNALRDEAVSIAAMRMEQARSLEFTSTATTLTSDTVAIANCPSVFTPTTGVGETRTIRNTAVRFCTNRAVAEIGGDGDLATVDADTRRVTIIVAWTWKEQGYTHAIQSVVRKQQK